MLIRCEHCATLYELEEALLAPTGSQVQCTKCQHVFTAFPAQGQGGTPVGAAVEPESAAAPPREERPASPSPEPRAPTASSSPRADARPTRSGPPPVYRPPTSGMGAVPGSGVGRTPVLRRDAVGSFEARLRWSARWRWLAPTLVALVVVGAVAAWFLIGRAAKPDPAARLEALSLVARDDAASLDAAIARLDDEFRSGGSRAAAADRALAQVMRAAVLLEEREAVAARRTALLAEREQILREQPSGWEDAERTAAEGARDLDSQARALEEQARMLGASAVEALRVLQAEVGDTPDVARGVAAYHALGGDRARAEKAIRTAHVQAAPDPWLELVQGSLDAGAADRAVRERALVALATLASAHPELLRGRYLLARTQASLGLRAEALATLERMLVENPRHAGATRLRDDLAESPEPSQAGDPDASSSAAPPATPEPRPERKPPAPPRKIVSRAPAGSPPPSETPVPAEAPPPVEAAPVPPPQEAENRAVPAPAAPPVVPDAAPAPAPRPRRAPIWDAEQPPAGDGG